MKYLKISSGRSYAVTQAVGGEHLCRAAGGNHFSPHQQRGLIGKADCHVDIVQHRQHPQIIFFGQRADLIQDGDLVMQVQVGYRFIQKKDARLLGQGAGKKQALLLSAGKLAHPALRQGEGIRLVHGLADDLLILGGSLPEPVEVGVRPRATVSQAVKAGGRLRAWGTTAKIRARSVLLITLRLRPSRFSVPESAGITPLSVRMRVVLPAPLGPMMTSTEPASKLKLISMRI